MAELGAVVVRHGTVLPMDVGRERADRHRRADRRGPGRCRRGRTGGATRCRGDRRQRRHRDAGHDRHPPAPVADGDARLRRRLDPDPVLRLVLPRARPQVPPGGHLRRQPARAPSRPSTPASPPPWTGPTACRRSITPRRPSTPCRRCPARFVLAYGNIQAAPWEWTAQPEVRRFLSERKDAADDLLGVQLAFDVLGDPGFPERPPSRWLGSSDCRSPPTPVSGAPPTTTASG